MSGRDDLSLAELIASLARDVPDLLGKELRLARVEAKSGLDRLQAAMGRLALAIAFAIGAIGLALAAAVSALTVLLVSRGLEMPIASALSTAIVTAVAAVIAAALFWSARQSLRAARSSLDESVATLAESATSVMEKF